MVLTGRFSRSLHLFPRKYHLYVLRKKLLGSNKSAPSKLLAPVGECIFDRLWCDFAKQDTNLASESAPKDAKMHHRRAIRFDSRTAKHRSGPWVSRDQTIEYRLIREKAGKVYFPRGPRKINRYHSNHKGGYSAPFFILFCSVFRVCRRVCT